MGLEPLLTEILFTDTQAAIRSQFFTATGYGPSDLLSVNYEAREFLMVNGGHYKITGEGVQHISGPSPDLEDRWEF